MKVIILAASRGNRLGDLTLDRPKCMLEFGNTTILERQISILKDYGIKPEYIYVVAGYKSECISNLDGIHTIFNNNYENTDNAYSLWLALQEIKNTDILVLDGDIIYNPKVIKQMIDSTANAVLAIGDNSVSGNTGIVENDGRVIEIGKHVTSSPVYAGIMKLGWETLPQFIKELEADKNTWYTIPLNRLVKRVNFHIIPTKETVVGINTYFEYIEAKRIFKIEEYLIWVTGASGFLGNKLYHILKRNYKVIGTKLSGNDNELSVIDLSDKYAIEAFVKLYHPNVIINTAGIPDPEKCEANPLLAQKVNVEAVKYLVEVAGKNNIKIIQISSDYVFSGESWEPYKRDSKRNPKNYYGETKRQAEDIVNSYKNSLIVRIPVIYGYNNVCDKMTFPISVIQNLSEGRKMKLDNRQLRYPALIDDIAFSIEKALSKHGIIHITSSRAVTKYTWAQIIAHVFGLDASLLTIDENSNLENRPLHTTLAIENQDYAVSDIEHGTEILKNQMYCAFRLIYKSLPIETVYGKNVGTYRFILGQKLGASIPQNIIDEIDCIVPVPSSGLFYAMGMAIQTGLPYIQAVVKPDGNARSFQLFDIALREQLINSKLIPIPELLKNKTIILVDEAIFTGTTLKVVCDMMRACGVKRIYIAIPTPICRNICRQYVQPERRLLSADYSCEVDVSNYFRVEAVFFQKKEVFAESISDIKGICANCFDIK